VAEEPGTERTLYIQRFHIDGSTIGTPLPLMITDVSRPSLTWDGAGYGVTYAVAEDDILSVEFMRVGCIPPD
jgi:hypothetical protein